MQEGGFGAGVEFAEVAEAVGRGGAIEATVQATPVGFVEDSAGDGEDGAPAGGPEAGDGVDEDVEGPWGGG